jgi:ankyrin repeat protein
MDVFEACDKCDLETMKALVMNDLSFVKAKDDDGWTPLHYACAHEHLAMVEFLVSKGADVNATDRILESTPLHLASFKGHLAMVELLVSNGADVNTKDISDDTPLHMASSKGNFAMIEFLVSNGADVNAKDRLESTPLHFASREERPRALFIHIFCIR